METAAHASSSISCPPSSRDEGDGAGAARSARSEEASDVSDSRQDSSPFRKKAEKYRTRFFRLWGYIAIGLIVAFAIWLLQHVPDAIIVLVTGAIMAFVYAPITNWLNRRFHIPRLPATLIGLLCVILIVVFFIAVVIPPLLGQSIAFLGEIPSYVTTISDSWDQFNDYVGSQSNGAIQSLIASLLDSVSSQASSWGSSLAQKAASGIVSGVTSVVKTIVDVFMAIVVSFWLAKDFPSMEVEIANIVGPRRGEDYRIITSVFGRSLAGYLKGLIINSTCTGIIAGVGFWILGVPYSGLLGLITAVLNVIPYIGPWIGGALAFLVGLSVGIVPAILSIVVTVIAQQFTDNFISPKVMQTAVALHPVLVIIALLVGGAVGGAVGMIMAVPLTAAFKGVFIYYFEKKTGRQLVSKNGMLFRGEQFCDEYGNPRPACDALGVDISGDEGVPERIRAAMASSSTGTSKASSERDPDSERSGAASDVTEEGKAPAKDAETGSSARKRRSGRR